jgi:hypothetical protein
MFDRWLPCACATRALQLTIARTGHDLKSPVTAMGMALESAMERLLAAVTPGETTPLRSARLTLSPATSPRGGNSALLPCAEAYAALLAGAPADALRRTSKAENLDMGDGSR